MAVDVALDGDDAVEHLTVNRDDVIVLDSNLPGVHGDEVCRRVVAAGTGSRVLMLTAAGTGRDRVEGLGLGADDYLPRPFDFAELVARVRALGAGHAAGAVQRRRGPRPRAAGGAPGPAAAGAEPEGVRRPGVPARGRQPGRLGRGPA